MSKILLIVVLLTLAVGLQAAPAAQFGLPGRPVGGLIGGQRPHRPGRPGSPGAVGPGFGQGGFQGSPLAAPPVSNGGNAAGVGQATGNLFANAQGFGTNVPIGPFGSVSIAQSSALGVGK